MNQCLRDLILATVKMHNIIYDDVKKRDQDAKDLRDILMKNGVTAVVINDYGFIKVILP